MDVPPARPLAFGGAPTPPHVRRGAAFVLVLVALALAAPAAAQDAARDAPAQLSFADALELAADAPAVVAARRQALLAARALEVAASPVAFEAAGGYARTQSELRDPSLPEPEERSEGDVQPIELSATLRFVPYGPAADAVAAARDALAEARDAFADARAQSRIDTASSFLAALRAESDAQIAAAALELARERLDAARARAAAGAATAAEVAALATDLEAARIELESARRTAELARADLALLLGLAAPPRPVGDAPPATALPADLGPLVAALGSGGLEGARRALDAGARSDARAALRSVGAAERDVAAGIRERVPVASLSVGWDRLSADGSLSLGAALDTAAFQPALRASFDPDSGLQEPLSDATVSERFRLQVGVRIPLDPALGAAAEADRIALERSRAAAELTLERGRLDALRALDALAAAERGLELAALRAETARRSARDAATRLDLGRVGPLDARAADLDAQRAELALERAADALLLARMQFLAALGRSPMEVFR